MATRPNGWTSRARHAVVAAGLTAAAAGSQEPAGLTSARVDIDAGLRVAASFQVAGPAPTLTWREVPCTRVSGVEVRVNGRAVAARDSVATPWHFLRLDATETSPLVAVAYVVQARGSEWSVPLMVPAIPVRATASSVRAAVQVHVAGAAGRARFPAFASAGADWVASFSAVPSVVRLQPAEAMPCAGAAREPADGGLRLRVTLLALTMLLWIPLYFRWARRQGDA